MHSLSSLFWDLVSRVQNLFVPEWYCRKSKIVSIGLWLSCNVQQRFMISKNIFTKVHECFPWFITTISSSFSCTHFWHRLQPWKGSMRGQERKSGNPFSYSTKPNWLHFVHSKTLSVTFLRVMKWFAYNPSFTVEPMTCVLQSRMVLQPNRFLHISSNRFHPSSVRHCRTLTAYQARKRRETEQWRLLEDVLR